MPYLGKQSLDWIWFSGGEAIELEGVNLISSPLLADIQGNTQQRRQLWQQICKYDH